jgi:hypothetical protein
MFLESLLSPGRAGRGGGRVRGPGLTRKALLGKGHPQWPKPRQRFLLAPSDFLPLIFKKPSSPTARRIPVPNPVFYFPYGSIFSLLLVPSTHISSLLIWHDKSLSKISWLVNTSCVPSLTRKARSGKCLPWCVRVLIPHGSILRLAGYPKSMRKLPQPLPLVRICMMDSKAIFAFVATSKRGS